MRLFPLFCLSLGFISLQVSGESIASAVFPELNALCDNAQKDSLGATLRGLRTKESSANARMQRASLWPSVSAHLEYRYVVEDRQDITGRVIRNDLLNSVTARYPLFHWGAVVAAAKIGNEGQRRAKLENAQDLHDQRSQILSAYFTLLVKEKRLSVAQGQYDSFDNQIQSTLSSSTSALGLEGQQLQKTRMKLDLERLTGDIAMLKSRLKKLTGFADVSLHYDFVGFPASLTIPEDWKAENIRQTFTSLSYKSQAREQRLSAVQARADGLPVVDAVGGFYQDQVESINSSRAVDRNNYFAGVSMRWQIFNGFRSDAATAAANTRARRLSALAQQELSDARDAMAEDLRSLHLAAADYDVSLSKQRIASKEYIAQQELKKQGQSSKDSFDASQRAYQTSEANALESLGNFLILYEKIESVFELAKNS